MFFRKASLLIVALSLLSSCGWLRDKPKAQKSFEGGELDLSCLKVMPGQLQNLFAGRYTDSAQDQASVKAIWKCLDRSLNTFSSHTHGSNDGYYTNDELQAFANRYLPEDSLFSKNLVASIFSLKASVLGGNLETISQGEILKLRKKLNRFGEIILPLSPYIATLLKPYDGLTEGKMKNAGDELNKFVAEFAILLSDSETTVTWSTLSSFIIELEKYLQAPNPTALTVVREQIQVFQCLKVLVVGGDEFGIEKTKWKPIFKSISTIYNALYLSTTTSEMMEQLRIEIQSTDLEQKTATEKLSTVLKALKDDPTLYSKATIQLLADRWAKVLLLNNFLYPKSANKLEVKSFLGSPVLRKVTAYLIDEMEAVRNGDQSAALIAKMADHLSVLIEQAASVQNSPVSIEDLKELTSILKPLFREEKDQQALDSALSILQDVSSILIGKDSGKLTAKDFRLLLKKASDLYAAWKTKTPIDFNESLSSSLDVLIRAPSAPVISVNQIQELLDKCEKLFTKLELQTNIDWKKIKQMVINGSKLKAVLFGNTDRSITNYELTQITNTWNAFAGTSEIDEALDRLATFFKTNPYSSVRISDLMGAIDAFLPEDQKIQKLGLTPELIGSIKGFMVGGADTILERGEYAKASQIGYTVFRSLKPVLKSLPKDFKMGLNSNTFAVFEAAVQGLIDDKELQFSNNGLKNLLLSQFRQAGLKVQPQTVDKMLLGLNHRMFQRNKGPKPRAIPTTFSSSRLEGIKDFLQKTKLDYQDYERAFAGLDASQSLPGQEIFKRLTRFDSRNVLASIHPIINGATSKPYFSAKGKPPTDYYLSDLAYKNLIYHGLMWVFPAYEVEADPKKKSAFPRLSLNDLIDLFDDINDAVYELGLSFSPSSAKESAVKRMQSINLFTRTGNGDEYIDVMETVDFLTTTFAGKNLLTEVRQSLVKECYPRNLSFKTQDKFSIDCLTNEFFGKSQFHRFYSDVVPEMTDHYMGLNAADVEQYRNATLTAVNADWKKNGALDLADMETLVSIPYYVENIFIRLDQNFNGMLTFTEAMNGFPIFCREIKKAAGSSVKGSCEKGEDPKQVEAIYGHLLMKGVPPESPKDDTPILQKLRMGKDFILWTIYWNTLDRNPAVRDALPPHLFRKDLLSIISNLSTSIAPIPDPAPLSTSASSD